MALQIQDPLRATAQHQKEWLKTKTVCLLVIGTELKRIINLYLFEIFLRTDFLGVSLSAEAVKEHEAVLDGEEHNMLISSHDNVVTGVFDGEICELLSETSVEIPNLSDSMNENDYVTNGSPNGSSINNVLPRYSTRQTSKHGPAANATGNVDQQGKRLSRYNRRKQATSTQ
ncbi:hypothetical protein TorRG33x02_001260 [Trema orientale]|uniref:Uncharacterized protein n=1 Tax=Trema orientale TaxID=63057 RepID=A0A2P5G1C2_TREOI|nr:hypothetical protein TorRG33x02_001260 [Trema orientale]